MLSYVHEQSQIITWGLPNIGIIMYIIVQHSLSIETVDFLSIVICKEWHTENHFKRNCMTRVQNGDENSAWS